MPGETLDIGASVVGKHVLVVVPAFNERATIRQVIQSLQAHCPYADIVVVNDGSADDTGVVARACGARVLDLPINLGIGGAVQCGLKYAAVNRYDLCLQIDGDGQHDPRYVGDLIGRLVEEGADVALGSRFLAAGGFRSTRARRIGILLLRTVIAALTGRWVSDPTSGMRVFGRSAIEAFARYYPQEYPEPESVFMLLRGGYKLIEVPVRMRDRAGGVSSIGSMTSIFYMVKVLIAIGLSAMRNRLLPKGLVP